MNLFRFLLTAGRFTPLSVLALVVGGSLLGGCGDSGKDKPASQSAARVNRQEITVHQINHALALQRNVRPEAVEGASRQILEKLIDQEIAIQKAQEIKLDREPGVMQQIDAARREIVARAYMEKAAESAAKPTAAEVQKFFDEKPELFKERKVYNLQELNIESKSEQFAPLKDQLLAAKSVSDFIEFLRAGDFKFTGSQGVRAAEQLPMASLERVAHMRDGQASIAAVPGGVSVLVLANSRSQPVTIDQARSSIEQFILNERKRELATKEIKALRDSAQVEYIGKFSPPTPASAPAARAAVDGNVVSGLDPASVSKGLGLRQ